MKPPLVSIVIPCYNAAPWVREAIRSALDQTYSTCEVIVIDDGSTDHSLQVIKSFAAAVRWETGPNRGGNHARNRGFALARGEYLQFLDADDYLLPNKIAEQIKLLRTYSDADVFFSPVFFERTSGTRLERTIQGIFDPQDPWATLAFRCPQTAGLLIKGSALAEVGGWNIDFACCQEHELLLRLLKYGKKFVHADQVNAVYRAVNPGSIQLSGDAELRDCFLMLQAEMEEYLTSKGMLTRNRLTALNQARFRVARVAWQSDRCLARRIVSTILESQPDFVPAGSHVPDMYRLIFQSFGFALTEHVADLLRRLKPALVR